jgi:hypothetical protein
MKDSAIRLTLPNHFSLFGDPTLRNTPKAALCFSLSLSLSLSLSDLHQTLPFFFPSCFITVPSWNILINNIAALIHLVKKKGKEDEFF